MYDRLIKLVARTRTASAYVFRCVVTRSRDHDPEKLKWWN
jgi:hypothetical protein